MAGEGEKKTFDINELVKSVMENIKIEDVMKAIPQTQLPSPRAGYENEISQPENEKEEEEDWVDEIDHSSYSIEDIENELDEDRRAIYRPMRAVFERLENVGYERHESGNYVFIARKIEEENAVVLDLFRKDIGARIHATIKLTEQPYEATVFFEATGEFGLRLDGLNVFDVEFLFESFLLAERVY